MTPGSDIHTSPALLSKAAEQAYLAGQVATQGSMLLVSATILLSRPVAAETLSTLTWIIVSGFIALSLGLLQLLRSDRFQCHHAYLSLSSIIVAVVTAFLALSPNAARLVI